MSRSALFFVLAAFCQTFFAQTPEIRERIRFAYAERNNVGVLAELRALSAKDPTVFKANNYDYLLGRTAEKAGDLGEAVAAYQSVADRRSVLRVYALWHLSRLMRASGNLPMERIFLQDIVSFHADSLLSAPAEKRLAQSWFESENYGLAIRELELRRGEATPRDQPSALTRDERALLGEAYRRSGDTAKAKEIFAALITGLANPAQPDDLALAAARSLDELDAVPGSVPRLADYEHAARASIYQFNRDFARARLHYAAIVEDHPESVLVPDAIFQAGRGFAQQDEFADALKWYERVLEQFPEHPIASEVLLYAASAYARLHKHREALMRYRKYTEKYPDGERIDRANLNIIDVLRDQREETGALKWVAAVRDRSRGKVVEALALFAEARCHLSRTNWENAISALEKLEALPDLGGTAVAGGTTKNEVRFLRALALEQLRRYADAIELYITIPDGRNEFYGWRSTERLRALAGNEAAKQHIAAKAAALRSARGNGPDDRRRALQAELRLTIWPEERERLRAALGAIYASLPEYAAEPKFKFLKLGRQQPVDGKALPTSPNRPQNLADELLFLGLYDEAAPEVELRGSGISLSGVGTKADLDYTLAVLYTRGDSADRGAAFAESMWKLPADHQPELIPQQILELLYPAPYRDDLTLQATPRSVDPRFLLAIMRQESRFRSDVKSNAAARGLMQFISTTSSRVAAELGRENFRQDDLYDPSTAVLFGSHYTGNLLSLFPNQPAAVAASYNGGEVNMKRWLARAKSNEADRYVSEIVFSQTKDYVWRVMANYRVYQLLYDENLKRR